MFPINRSASDSSQNPFEPSGVIPSEIIDHSPSQKYLFEVYFIATGPNGYLRLFVKLLTARNIYVRLLS